MPRDLMLMAAVLAFAAAVRTLFFTGFFGSDEVTYTDAAYRMLSGDWRADAYVGANRYGVNLPVAAFGALFGQNLVSAGLFAMLCSLAEIALVMVFSRRWFGIKVAALAGLVLACLPMHVHLAGRLMADAPLALTMTAAFLFFWDGEQRRHAGSFAIAGLAAGASFWMKPAAMFYIGVFLLYPVLFRRWNWQWLWMALGFALMVLANNLLFLALTGDAWFLFKAMQARSASGYLEAGAVAGEIHDAPQYYLELLFARLHHTGLTAYLAAAGLWAAWFASRAAAEPAAASRRTSERFIAWWLAGLILLLSLLVISWRPLLFVPKQTNYMLMFAAPLCLLAALALARLKGTALAVVLVAVLSISLLLAGMHQGLVRVFTANSKAAVAFVAAHADATVYGPTNTVRAAEFHNLVETHEAPLRIHPLRELFDPSLAAEAPTEMPRYAVVDMETLGWGSNEPIRQLSQAPACWVREERLMPRVSGAGWRLLRGMSALAGQLQPVIGAGLASRVERLSMPAEAWVFRLPDAGCEAVPRPAP